MNEREQKLIIIKEKGKEKKGGKWDT